MSKQKTDFQRQLEELEQIVAWFESADVDIDQALEKFERGMELASRLEQQLGEAENTVREITRKFGSDVLGETEETPADDIQESGEDPDQES